MLNRDEGALICDFAETYHVFDIYSLKPTLAATLACGLGNDARIRRDDMRLSFTHALLAGILDCTRILIWQRTKDAEKGRNKPKSVLEFLNKKEPETVAFDSTEDFRKEWERIARGN